jgi:prepilin-type N-terminal cleavage/methylation domain-containing protein
MSLVARHASLHGRRGFTLVEVLVSIALSLVVLAGFTAFNRFQLFALRNQATQIDLQLTARTIVDLIAREVRRAGMDPTCAKNFDTVRRASSKEIRIQSDLNSNGSIGTGDENIRYRYNSSNNSIERITSNGTDALLDNVAPGSLTFSYYDANGNALVPNSWGDEDDVSSTGGYLNGAQRTSVRRIRVALSLADDAVDPLDDHQLKASFSTDVDLRNRYFLGSTVCP